MTNVAEELRKSDMGRLRSIEQQMKSHQDIIATLGREKADIVQRWGIQNTTNPQPARQSGREAV